MSSMGKLKRKEVVTRTPGQQLADYILEMLTVLYIIAILVIFPLYYDNKYFNMGEAKFKYFITASEWFLGLAIIAFIYWIAMNYKEESFKNIFRRYSVTDWFAVGYLLVSYVSFLASANKTMALDGHVDWNMGLVSQAVFVLVYFFVSRFWKWSPIILQLSLLSGFIVCMLAVLMRFGFDPLEMYDRLSAADIEKFVSTIGQTSWYSGYAILIYALGMYWYFNDDVRFSRILSGIFVVVGAASIVTVNSDSAFVALPLIFLVFFWYGFENNKAFSRFLQLAVLVFSAFRIVGFLQDTFPERRIEHVADTEAICEFLNHSVVSVVVWAVLVAMLIGYTILLKVNYDSVRQEQKFDIGRFKIVRKIVVVLAVLVVWAVILLIILTTNNKLPAGLSGLRESGFFNFADAWGNHRGFNWRMSIEALRNASFKDLMIGVGPDCFSIAMNNYCQPMVHDYWHGQVLACAHNEFLNMTVTEGILGIVSYLGIMISSAVRLAKCAYKEVTALPFLAIILAYIGHNFFCYQTCCSTPFLFIFIGMGEMVIRETKKGQVSGNN